MRGGITHTSSPKKRPKMALGHPSDKAILRRAEAVCRRDGTSLCPEGVCVGCSKRAELELYREMKLP